MNSKQVAEILKVSGCTVSKLVRDGKLSPVKHGSVLWFDDNQVIEFAKTYVKAKAGRKPGFQVVKTKSLGASKEAMAFRMFAAGQSWRDVVIECEIGIEQAIDLHKKFRLEPEQIEALEKMRRQERDFQARAKENRRERKAEEWRKHQQRMAELRIKAPAPIMVRSLDTSNGQVDPKVIPDTNPVEPAAPSVVVPMFRNKNT